MRLSQLLMALQVRDDSLLCFFCTTQKTFIYQSRLSADILHSVVV